MIALKLLEESQEYICAFLRSPVTDFHHYGLLESNTLSVIFLKNI